MPAFDDRRPPARAGVLAAALLALPLCAAVGAPAPPKAPLEVVAESLGDDFTTRVVATLCAGAERMTRAGSRPLRDARPDLSADDLAAFDARLADAAPRLRAACEERARDLLDAPDGPRAAYVERARAALAAAVAPKELEQLRTFLASPPARHLAATRRDLDVATYEQVGPWMQQVGPALYGELGMMLRAEVGMPPPQAVAPAAAPAGTAAIPAKLRNSATLGERCGAFYPDSSRRAGEQGSVVLLVHLSDTGRVIGLLLETSSGYPSLDIAAAGCVGANGEFEPLRINGAPAASWQRMKWTWRLSD